MLFSIVSKTPLCQRHVLKNIEVQDSLLAKHKQYVHGANSSASNATI